MSNTINFEPTVLQYDALMYLLDDTTDEVMYGGAAGGGKSFLGCAWLVIMCSKYPGSRWMMGRSKLATLKTTTLKTFFEVCRKFGIRAEFDYVFNASSNIITFKNGSEIILKDLFLYPSDPEFDSLGSLEIAGAFLDEVAQISRKAKEVVKSRLGWKMPDGSEIKPKIFYSCNPNKGWSYKEFYQPHNKGELNDNLKFVQALPSTNQYLSKGRQKSLDNLTGVERKRLLLGQWEYDSDPASLIEYDSIMNLFTNEHIITDQGTKRGDNTIFKNKCITWDVAGKGRDSAVIIAWKGLHAVTYREIKTDDGTIQTATVKAFQQQYGIANSEIVFDNDGIGGFAGMNFPGAYSFNNGSSPLNRENYQNVKSQCYFKLAEVVNKNEMYFPIEDDDIQQRVTEELEQVKRKDIDKDGKLAVVAKEQVKAVIGRSPDFSDAMMMRMLPLVKHKNQNFNDTYSFASF